MRALPPVVLITAFPDHETRVRATHLGAAMLAKPFARDRLSAAVRLLLPS